MAGLCALNVTPDGRYRYFGLEGVILSSRLWIDVIAPPLTSGAEIRPDFRVGGTYG